MRFVARLNQNRLGSTSVNSFACFSSLYLVGTQKPVSCLCFIVRAMPTKVEQFPGRKVYKKQRKRDRDATACRCRPHCSAHGKQLGYCCCCWSPGSRLESSFFLSEVMPAICAQFIGIYKLSLTNSPAVGAVRGPTCQRKFAAISAPKSMFG